MTPSQLSLISRLVSRMFSCNIFLLLALGCTFVLCEGDNAFLGNLFLCDAQHYEYPEAPGNMFVYFSTSGDAVHAQIFYSGWDQDDGDAAFRRNFVVYFRGNSVVVSNLLDQEENDFNAI